MAEKGRVPRRMGVCLWVLRAEGLKLTFSMLLRCNKATFFDTSRQLKRERLLFMFTMFCLKPTLGVYTFMCILSIFKSSFFLLQLQKMFLRDLVYVGF